MALQIEESQRGDVTLLRLNGILRIGPEAEELKARLQTLVTQKKSNIVMNLGELTYIDSYGLGELVACLTAVKKSGGAFKLAQPTEFVRDVLRTTRLDSLFASYTSDDEALASFASQGHD